jgi:transcriptional regulator with XRE-family HTH domain
MDLKTLRTAKRKTQLELWLKTGICQSRISLIESNYIKPTAMEKQSIARALKVGVDEINWDMEAINA